MSNGSIPVLSVRGANLPLAWERAVLETYRSGCDIKTEYDKEDDPPSKDCSMTIVVDDPAAEPMIHKDFPGGLEDLHEYTLEVLDGIKDHCVRSDAKDTEDTRWEYTYHQRLSAYAVPSLDTAFDQIHLIAERLAKTPHSRRAQAVTWKVWEDNFCTDPACLQSIWCRLLKGDDDIWYLNTNIRFRSNDAYKAAFMNMYALVRLQERIARYIYKMSGKEVRLGRYVHQADSFHIYGAYFTEVEERFIRGMKKRSFEERTFRYEDVQDIMLEYEPAILAKAQQMGRKIND
jgi:thymidylate synthase